MINIDCESSYHYLGDKIDLYLLSIFQLFGEKSEEAEELRKKQEKEKKESVARQKKSSKVKRKQNKTAKVRGELHKSEVQDNAIAKKDSLSSVGVKRKISADSDIKSATKPHQN